MFKVHLLLRKVKLTEDEEAGSFLGSPLPERHLQRQQCQMSIPDKGHSEVDVPVKYVNSSLLYITSNDLLYLCCVFPFLI